MRKNGTSDPSLLSEWLHHHREAAFRELVGRYAGLVHATARRVCGDEVLAAEATQLTFILLAQKAKSLSTCASLGGWLHRTAMMHSKNLLRSQQREQRKLQQLAMETQDHTHDETWREMQPVIDSALASLSDQDREALLLRFYRSLSIREVAETLGIATDAAQKRIDRATERLRGKLLRRGLQAGGSLSAAMLAGFAADAQAAALPISILTSKAIAAGAVGTSLISNVTAVLSAVIMKTTSVAVPLFILLAAVAWIANQFHSITGLEQQIARLKDRLAANQQIVSTPTERFPIKTVLDRKPVDWEEVARQLGNEGCWYLQTNLPLLERLRAMSEVELIASLNEIAASRISQQSHEVLDQHLGKLLMTINPELGLTRFVPRYNDENWRWLLAGQLEHWAKEDPDKAVAWFTEQVAAGSFNRRGLGRGLNVPHEMVSETFFALLSSAPQAAGRLLLALPENQRLESLGSLRMGNLRHNKHDQLAWAKVVRQYLPDSDRNEAITWPTGNWSDGDGSPMSLMETSDYLVQIEATPQEVEACVMRVAGQMQSWRSYITNDPKTPAEDLEALRAWVIGLAPQILDRATAKGLGGLANSDEIQFSEVVKLALNYRGSNESDELLIPVLDASNDENRELARMLAAHLSNAYQREMYLEKFKPRSE